MTVPTSGLRRPFFRSLALTIPILIGVAGWPVQAHAQGAAGVDPKALAILKRSTDYLAGLKQFSVDTHATIEAVLDSGQKLMFDNAASATVQRPNKLVARRKGDLVNQVFYYDGKTLTLSNPDQKVFASVAAPGTLEEMLDYARDSLNIIAPAGDLLYKNAYELLTRDAKSVMVVGKSVVGGVRCDHLAFRGPEVDWQIWIQEGAQPLPRRFVVTSTQVPGSPQFVTVMNNWNTTPKLTDGMFAFTPPKGASKIEFLRVTAGGAPAKQARTGAQR